MKSKLFKRITASALALLMVCASVPSGSDFSQFFTGSKIIASAQNEVSVKHANEYGKEEDIVLDPENFNDSSSYCYVDRSLQHPAINISGRGLYDGINNYLGIPFKVYDEDGAEADLFQPYDAMPFFYSIENYVSGKEYYAVRDYVEANKDNWDENAEPIEQTEFYTVQHKDDSDNNTKYVELKPSNFTAVSSQIYTENFSGGLIVYEGYGCIDKPTLTGFIFTRTSDFAVYNGFTGRRVSVNKLEDYYYSFAAEQGVDYYVVNGDLNKCGDSAWYELVDTDDNDIPDKLVIGGKGEMYDYEYDGGVDIVSTPWNDYRNDIKSIEIASGITHIGNWAFSYCKNADSVTFGKNSELKTIGENAFMNNSSINSITIPKCVETVKDSAFAECDNLVSVVFEEDSHIETIGDSAFSCCESLNNIIIPKSVKTIEGNAFYSCGSMTDIYMSADPNKEGFSWEDDFDDFIKPAGSKKTKCHVPMEYLDSYKTKYAAGEDTDINVTFVGGGKCGDNAWWEFDSESGKLTINGTGDMYDYEQMSYVPWHSLRDENKIAAIEIAEGITKIGTRNFSDFKNKLKNVNIPASVKEIGDLAFYYSMGITTVTFAEGSKLETIGSYAFSTLTSLAQITIPESIRKIGLGAFKQDFTLSSAYLSTDPTLLTWNIDSDNPEFMADKNTTCYVPGRYLAGYKEKFTQNADEDKNLNATLACKNQCGENAWWEFDSESGKLTINGTGDMWDYKFNYTYNVPGTPWYDYKDDIKTVEISEGITTVGIMAFYSLTELTSVSIPSTVKKINGYAFTYCASLSSLTFATESKLEFIGDHSFLSVDLTDIVLPEGVTTIEYSAFGNSSSIKSVTLPSTISSINVNAFAHCSNLDNIYIYSDPSKLTWNADQYESGNFKPNKGTKCHVPKEYYATYIEKYAKGEDTDINVTFVVDDCKVTVAKSTGGKVTADKTSVTSGDTVNLTVKPNTGYKLKSLTVKDSNDKVVTVTDNAFVMPVDNVTVTAVFEKKKFTVKFVNDDGTVLQTETLAYGAMPEYKGETPTKAKTAQYTYTFNGWDKTPASVTGDVTYTATYTSTVNKYTVKFVNDDGTVLQTESLEYGAMPVYKGETPTKAKTAQYTYTFKGWDKTPASVTGDVTYTATYTNTVNQYTVRFVNDDGTVLQTESLEYGAMPVYKGETPTKAKTAQYTYTFNGWNKDIVAVTKAATYKATFTSEINKYTVRFVNDDGTVLQTETLAYGAMPEYKGETPTKAKTAQYTYTFNGWNKDIVAVSKAATYKATYTSEINKYTLTLPKNFSVDGTAASSYDYGTVVKFKVNSGYVVIGDVKNGSTVMTASSGVYSVKITKDTAITAITGVKVAAKKATCTVDGNTLYYKGSDGNYYKDTKGTKITLAETVIPATGHAYGAPVWTWNGTKSATAKFTCANDKSHVENFKATITSETTKATCTTDGKTVYTATVEFDGKTYTDTKTVVIEKTGHNYGEPEWTWNGTKSASAKFTCANDNSHIKNVKATITSETTKATCTADGKTVYTATVEFGGKTYTDTKTVVIEKTGHAYGEPAWTWNGTKSATAKFTCANDKSHVETAKATITSETTKATCTTDGKTVYTATVEFGGKTYTDTKTVVIEKTGHAYGAPVWTWTGTTKATAKFTCANDKSHVENVKATITSETTKATCTADGKTVYTATVEFGGKTYTDTKTVVIEKTGHKYGAPVWTWNGTKSASAKFTCANDNSHVENFKATITSETTKATCTTDGKTVYTATVEFGGKTYTDTKTVVIPAKGHKYGAPVWTWTGTTKATAKFTCANDNSHIKNVKATITSETTKATCTADGKTVYTATVEFGGKTYTDTKTVKIDKTGHSYGEPEWTWNGTKSATAKFTCANDNSHIKNVKATITSETTKATCTADGKTVYTATVEFNGKTYTDTKTVVIEKTGHKFGEWKTIGFSVSKGTATQKRKCSVCGKSESRTVENALKRISGDGRYATAAAISKETFKKADTVVLAYGLNYTDALAGVPLANMYKAPILLTGTDSLPKETLNEIKRLGAKKVIIIGGEGAISKKVVDKLKSNGLKTERISGTSRFGTAAAIAKKMTKSPAEIFFVYAYNYADALSASAVAAAKNAPIIYLKKNGKLDDDTAKYLASVKGKVKNAYVIGGKGVIEDDIMANAAKALGLKVGSTVVRVAGSNRFETCVAVNKKFKSVLTGNGICIATGFDFPDALAGGVLAAQKKIPMFLANGKLSESQTKYLASRKIDFITVLGGQGAVPDSLVREIAKASV